MTISQKREYTRGALAKESGVNLETIRFYEKLGMMPDPPRSDSGYRVYSKNHLKRLKFIRRTRELGFTNGEVKQLLEMVDGALSCDAVKGMAMSQVDLIKSKVADLKKLQAALESMAADCKGGQTPNCAIVDQLMEYEEG